MAQITLQGKPVQTNGDLPKPGDNAPAFTLTQTNLKDISLDQYMQDNDSQHLLLSIVPSLDTPVCATTSDQFEKMTSDWPEVKFLVVSADLPFAQQRFCASNNIKNVTCLSSMRHNRFAQDYGVLMQDGKMAGIMARAIVIISNGKVVHSQLVSEIVDAPDFQAITTALQKL